MKKTALIITSLVAAVTVAYAAGVKCPGCNGTGWRGSFKCATCGGDGVHGN